MAEQLGYAVLYISQIPLFCFQLCRHSVVILIILGAYKNNEKMYSTVIIVNHTVNAVLTLYHTIPLNL